MRSHFVSPAWPGSSRIPVKLLVFLTRRYFAPAESGPVVSTVRIEAGLAVPTPTLPVLGKVFVCAVALRKCPDSTIAHAATRIRKLRFGICCLLFILFLFLWLREVRTRRSFFTQEAQ